MVGCCDPGALAQAEGHAWSEHSAQLPVYWQGTGI